MEQGKGKRRQGKASGSKENQGELFEQCKRNKGKLLETMENQKIQRKTRISKEKIGKTAGI